MEVYGFPFAQKKADLSCKGGGKLLCTSVFQLCVQHSDEVLRRSGLRFRNLAQKVLRDQMGDLEVLSQLLGFKDLNKISTQTATEIFTNTWLRNSV